MNKECIVLKTALRAAGKAVMKIYGKNIEINQKDDKSPVTEADLVSEKILLKYLGKFGYGVLSEESEDNFERLAMKRVWIMDPLDGTKDFLAKTGDFTLMVGLVEDGEVILSGVYKPVGDRLFYAMKGKGAFLEEFGKVRKIFVSKRENCADLRFLVSRFHLRDEEIQLSKSLGIKEMVKSGSAGLKACLIAANEADLYLNTSDKTFEWDICAADLIVSEAGGLVTDRNGKKIIYNKNNPRNLQGFLVSNGQMHSHILLAASDFRV